MIKKTDMTEQEILNFSYDFINLINEKNNEIWRLKEIIKTLEEQLESIKTRRLAYEEVIYWKRPVWVQTKHKNGFYAIPVTGGVKTGKGGIYGFCNYGITWIAYSEKPEKKMIGEDDWIEKKSVPLQQEVGTDAPDA